MMKAFILPTMNTRLTELMKLLKSINDNTTGWTPLVVTQRYTAEQKVELDEFLKTLDIKVLVAHYEAPQGCFGARKRALELWAKDFNVFCNIDDDMIVLPSNNYDKMAEFILKEKGAGYVSGNWGRTEKLANAKIMKMEDKFIKQPVVHTGGGLIYTTRVLPYMMALPDNIAYEDSEMTGTAYANGFENYRYLGSIIIHAVVTKGGLIDWRKEFDGTLLQNLFDYKKEKKDKYGTVANCYCEPISKDLTKSARAQHIAFKELMGAQK